MGYSKFMQNPKHENKLCYPTNFNIWTQWRDKYFDMRLLQLNVGPKSIVIFR